MLLYDVITKITLLYFNNFSKFGHLRYNRTLNIFCTFFYLNTQNPKCVEKSGLYKKMLLFIHSFIFPFRANNWTQALYFQISKLCDDRRHSLAKIPIYFIAILAM